MVSFVGRRPVLRALAYFASVPLLGVGLMATSCGGRTADDAFLTDTSDGGSSGKTDAAKDDVAACTNTVTDPHNCGSCGHDCQGGACEAGVCQPFVLAAAEEFPSLLRVDDRDVYWLNAGGFDGAKVRAVPKAGGSSRTVAKLPDGAMGVSMALDEGHVYWLAMAFNKTFPDGSLQRTNKDGSELLTLFEHTFAFQLSTLVTDGADVYWVVGQSPTAPAAGIMRATTTGEDAHLWSHDGLPLILADAPDALYAATSVGAGEEIVAYDKGTGARRTITVATWVSAMATNTNDIFFAHDFVPTGGNEVHRAWKRVSKQGGPVAVLGETSGIGAVVGEIMAADDERVYVTEIDAALGQATLKEIRTDGSDPKVLWEAQSQIWALASDETSVYWVADEPNSVGRSLWKLAKPAR
jgi:hypothetical protein